MTLRVAVIGAGMAGLACGKRLSGSGLDVSLFDKGRGPGGRMSTRRVSLNDVEVGFDHGAQFFTARDAQFRAEVEAWSASGHAAPWPAAGEGAWVGVPAMNAPIAAMAAALKVQFSFRVERLERQGASWRIIGVDKENEAYDAVVIAVPAEQVAPLIIDACPNFAALAQATPSAPCWTVMVAFAERVGCDNDALRPSGPIGWAARNSSKPGRAASETWVIQASPEWSRHHQDHDQNDVTSALLSAFTSLIGAELPQILHLSAHRWLYARSGQQGRRHLWDAEMSLGVCGDWLVGPRVEGAWLSGLGLAETILRASSAASEIDVTDM